MNTSQETLTIYHTGDNYKVSQILALAESDKIKAVEQNISKDPLSGTQLLTLCNKMQKSVEKIVDTESDAYQESLKKSSFDDADWLQLLTEHPELIKTPIVEKGDEIMLINTPTDVLKMKNIDNNIDRHEEIN